MTQEDATAGKPSDIEPAKSSTTANDGLLSADLTDAELSAVAGGTLFNGNYGSVSRTTTK